MAERHPACIGRVSHVLGATVTVRLDTNLAGIAPLWRGRLQPVGQVGSIVAIPQGPVRLLASVELVGLSELSGSLPPVEVSQVGDRWLRLQLLGELDAVGSFRRGVSSYPGLDDPVHFVSPEVLTAIHPQADSAKVLLGSLSSNPDVSVALDAQKLITRHSVLVGSTGSGKTSAVATLVQNLVRGGWSAANIVIIDPHGEYTAALAEDASVRSVAKSGSERLRVPFWALPAADILRALAGPGVIPSVTNNRFAELVSKARSDYAMASAWLSEASAIGADTPIPFDIRSVWHDLDYENSLTVEAIKTGEPCVVEDGDPQSLHPTRFRPNSPNNTAPFKGPSFGYHGTIPERIRSRLADARFEFFLSPSVEVLDVDPLAMVIDEWLGGTRAVSVLDFSGIPVEAADLAIGVIMQLLFEVSIRSKDGHGIGRTRPTLVVMEEAHRYLSGEGDSRLAAEHANRIAREGRKYGIGLMLVSQRPSELPDTAFSQAGTVIALRLTNAADQGRVRSGLPDNLAGLAEALPSLRTGEAIVAGEAVNLPSRVIINQPMPAPRADDPSLDGWSRVAGSNDISKALASWRGTQVEETDD